MKKYLVLLTLLFSTFYSSNSDAFCFEPLNFSPTQGLYIGAVGGFNGGFALKCQDVTTELGYYLGLKFGKKFSEIIRLEEEIIFQSSSMHAIKVGTLHLHHVRGYFNIWSFMTNVLFNFNCDFPLRPFIGGGIGCALESGHWSGNLIEQKLNYYSFEQHIKVSFDKTIFAWQALAGLRFLICPDWEVSLEYRYLHLTNCVNNHKLGLALINFF